MTFESIILIGSIETFQCGFKKTSLIPLFIAGMWTQWLAYLLSGSRCHLFVNMIQKMSFLAQFEARAVVRNFWKKDLQVNKYLGNQHIILRSSLVQWDCECASNFTFHNGSKI